MLRWILMLLLAPALHAEFAGTYSGVLEVSGTKLRLVLKFEGGTATLGSPDQSAEEFPADQVTFHGDRVRVVVKKFQAEYAGRVDGDTIDGQWRQPGVALPLRMQRVEKVAKLRPQEPDGPLPYEATEVCWTSAVRLCGTLTVPKEPPRIAIVLLAGSGPLDRDGFAFGHRPMLVLADRLTREGFAVLRFDHRADYPKSTTHDRAIDAASALAFLRKRYPRVGFIGHSEGGLVAALAAECASFIVMLNAPGLPGRELFRMRAERLARASGRSEEEIARELDLRERVLDGQQAAGFEELAAFREANATWLSTYFTIDPARVLARVEAPLLIVAGALDQQVPADANAYALAAAKRAGGHTNVEIAVLPGINHQLQTARSGAIAEYTEIEETVAESVLRTVTRWLDPRAPNT
jgi:hypothetical protein